MFILFLKQPAMNGFQSLQRDWGVHNVWAGACCSMKSVIIMLLNDSKQKLLWVVKYFPISVSKRWGEANCSRCFEIFSGNKAVTLCIQMLQSWVKNSVLESCDFWGTRPWLKITLKAMENLSYDLYFRCKMWAYLDQCPSRIRRTWAVVKSAVAHPQKAAAKPHLKQQFCF